MNILIKISYDGTNYCGWQKQPSGHSVQEAIEIALSSLYNKTITVTGCSRTDAGVHALGQYATFTIESNPIPINKVPLVLNHLLNKDIVVTSAQVVSSSCHPQYDAKRKIYCYTIDNNKYPNPLTRNTAWHISHPLNKEKMKSAASAFIGTHDFIGFCTTGSSVKSTIREICDINIEEYNNILTLKVSGNGFLYNMVRIITGTLVWVGTGKITENISNIILSGERALAGETAPAKGLCLLDVFY